MSIKMGLKKHVKFISIVWVICFCAGLAFAEETPKNKDKAKETAETAAIFEKVLKEYELKKQIKEDELANNLNTALTDTINSWLDAAKTGKDALMGTRLKQNWEKLAASFKVAPTHYEYNLRGYNYTIVKNEVFKTLSLTTVYKGIAVIREDLYVEKYHSPDVSNADPYFYTVTTTYVLNYEYKGDKFELVSTESQITGFVNDAPAEIKRPRPLI